MSTTRTNLRGRSHTPTRMSDQVLRSFGNMSEPWCQLIHNEGNVGRMTIVADNNTLPLVLRPQGTPLDHLRRGLILGRGLPERSVMVVVDAATIGRLGISGALYLTKITDAFSAIDLRITPPEVRLPHGFALFDQPPAGEPVAAFAQPNGELQRFVGNDATRYQEMLDRALTHSLSHEQSITLMSDLAVDAMLTKPVVEYYK